MSPRKLVPRTGVAYIRVSTKEQEDNGAGADIQEAEIIADAAEANIAIVAFCRDMAETGSNGIENRAGLAEALDWIQDGDADCLLVYRIDRLARDLVLQEQLLAEVWRKGGTVRSTSPTERVYLQPDDRTDPSRALIRQVLGAVAEYERKMIVLRMTNGRRRKIATTGWGGGPRPYGWCGDAKGGLVPEPVEQAVLRYIHEQRQRRVTYDDIADELTRRGTPKATGVTTPWVKNEVHRSYTRALARWAKAGQHEIPLSVQ